ncbi:hypothetical protein ACFFR3_19730 [Nonomuraea salmonea]|uniref:Uncharacterized protein n=1 Tax=Nonomuraea salmonea TaxID=46181 RepID=A0ABV5NNH1_9ACTN
MGWHSAVCPVMGLRGELRTTTAAGSSREADHVLAGRPAAVAVGLAAAEFASFLPHHPRGAGARMMTMTMMKMRMMTTSAGACAARPHVC